MKDYDNSSFYKSKAWRRVSTAYMTSKNYICERCGRPAAICHHKQHLNGQNVTDPAIALSFDNLEALCQDCHNEKHFSTARVKFDGDGNVIGVRKTDEEKQFDSDQRKTDELLKKMTP